MYTYILFYVCFTERSRTIERKLGGPAEFTIGEVEKCLSHDSSKSAQSSIKASSKSLDDSYLSALTNLTGNGYMHGKIKGESVADVDKSSSLVSGEKCF